MASDKFFPDIITNLPEADIPICGLHTHLFQGADQQFVFMSFECDVEILFNQKDRYAVKYNLEWK